MSKIWNALQAKRNIEWANDSWNPITGCLGPADYGQPFDEDGHCEGCYAKFRALNRLRGRFGYDEKDPFKLTWHEDKLLRPLKRKKPTVYFAFSMGEWLAAPSEWRQKALQVMISAKWHVFITLTKQYDKLHLIEKDINRMLGLLGTIPPHIWIGVSICYRNQLYGLDKLRELDAPLKFGCFEPMMEDLSDADLTGLDWIIIGGRTRQGKTPAFIPEKKWVQNLVYRAKTFGLGPIPVFLKPNLGDYVANDWFNCRLEQMPFDRIGGWPKWNI